MNALWCALLAVWAVVAAAAPTPAQGQALLDHEEQAQAMLQATLGSTRTLAATMNGSIVSGQSLNEEEALYSIDGSAYIVAQSDGNFVMYDAALVAFYGESYRTAIFASGTYTTTPINPYSLVMQEVCDTQEDCNLVMYNGLALTNGYSAATAVWNSATWNWAAFAPCQLVVSGAQGGSFYIVERNGHKIFQRPATLGLGPSPAPPASTLTPGFLYPFSGMTFSTCGVQGALGPIDTSLCAATYLPYGTWVNNPTFMHVDEGVQTWAAPATATYSIEAAGAAGGASTYSGGVGAAVSGHVRLTAGTVLYILIGQTGLPGPDAGGGGGGTYILIGDRDTPLMVAGGGGGGNMLAAGGSGGTLNDTNLPVGGAGGIAHPVPSNASDATAGSSGQPGRGGDGGAVSTDAYSYIAGGGGGGGALGNSNSTYAGGFGGADVNGSYPGVDGGFGGGGGSGAGSGSPAAGGGGGWAGGQGGYEGASTNFTALGGTSYASGAYFATTPVFGRSGINGPGFARIDIVSM